MGNKTLTIYKMQNFLKEFDFSGISSARFYNTLFVTKDKVNYIINYFRLIDNPNTNALISKMNSKEFKAILKEFEDTPGVPNINNRLILYFGNQGTGKTTHAIKEYPEAKVMNCNSNFEPNDLLYSFDFEDGINQLKNLGFDAKEDLEEVAYNREKRIQVLDLIIQAGGRPKYKPTSLLNGMIGID